MAGVAPRGHPGSTGRIGVLVVSQVPLLREGICRIVDRMRDAGVVASVGTLPAGLELLRRRRVDVIVVDEQLDASFQVVRALREQAGTAGMFVLLSGAPATASRAAAAVAAGATCVMPLTSQLNALAEAMRAAARAVTVVEPKPTGDLRTVVALSGPGGVLSPREAEILQLMAFGLDNRSIAERLVLSVDTVRTHAKNLARKLGARARSEVIAMAYQSGFMRSCA